MSLQNWLNNGWLIEHQSSPQEINDLLNIVDRDLKDSQISGLSADWRLNIAYNAALQVATAALAISGFRVARESHHYRIIQSLAYTMALESKIILHFNQFRKKRNIGGYERAGLTSDQEAREMLKLAKNLRAEFDEWINKKYPNFL